MDLRSGLAWHPHDHNQMLWLLNTLATNTSAPTAIPINAIKETPIPIPTTSTTATQTKSSFTKSHASSSSGSMRRSSSYTNTANFNNSNNNDFADMVSPEYNGSFFDNVAVRSHSYTSLSRLARLAELNESISGPIDDDDEEEEEDDNDARTTFILNQISRKSFNKNSKD
eukprot:225819_1